MKDAGVAMILVRLALYLSLGIGFGLPAFALWAPVPALRRWLLSAITLATIGSIASLALLAGQMGGGPVWPVDWETVGILLDETALGTAWIVRLGALLVAAAATYFGRVRTTAMAGGIALATLAWAGHGAMDDGAAGWIHLSADVLHLLASGVWLGALLGLIVLVARPAHRCGAADLRQAHRALAGFAPIGSAVVGILIVTGLANTWLLIGPAAVASASATRYGQLLLLKLGLFAAMLGLAALNRFQLTPRFERAMLAGDTRAALARLRTSLAVETGCAVLILAIVAWIGTLEPPVSGG